MGYFGFRIFKMKLFIAIFLFSLQLIAADIPANCTHHDLIGDWLFEFSEGGNDKFIDCQNNHSELL